MTCLHRSEILIPLFLPHPPKPNAAHYGKSQASFRPESGQINASRHAKRYLPIQQRMKEWRGIEIFWRASTESLPMPFNATSLPSIIRDILLRFSKNVRLSYLTLHRVDEAWKTDFSIEARRFSARFIFGFDNACIQRQMEALSRCPGWRILSSVLGGFDHPQRG